MLVLETNITYVCYINHYHKSQEERIMQQVITVLPNLISLSIVFLVIMT